MTLEQFLRGKLSTLFVPLIKKDKCEICNSKDRLHLHHMKPFAVMLEETLDELDLRYHKDKDNYTDIEIKNITNNILGKHLDSYYLTLCKDCHSHLHKIKDGSLCNITAKHEEYRAKGRLKNELMEKYRTRRIKEVIIPYLDSIVDEELFKNKQEELINKIDLRDSKNRLQKSIGLLNEYLIDKNIPYEIISKRSSKRINRKIKSYRYWIIQKINSVK